MLKFQIDRVNQRINVLFKWKLVNELLWPIFEFLMLQDITKPKKKKISLPHNSTSSTEKLMQ